MAEIEKKLSEGGLWSLVSLSVTISIITLLFTILSLILNLEWSPLDQTLLIIITASPLAILVTQSKWDEKILARKIKRDTSNKNDTEKFILYVGFLFKSWITASKISRDHQELMQLHLQAVLKGKDLESDFRGVKLGYSGIIVSTCLISSFPLVYLNTLTASSDYLVPIILGSITWVTIQTVALLRFLSDKVNEASKTTWYYVKYRASMNYISMFNHDNPGLGQSRTLGNDDTAGKKHEDLIHQLTERLQTCENAVQIPDWPMFTTRLAIVSKWVDYTIGKVILFGFTSPSIHGSLLREMLDFWSDVVISGTIEADARFHYLRNMAARLYVIGPAQLRSQEELTNILKLTNEEVKQAEVLMAVGTIWIPLDKFAEDYDKHRDAYIASQSYEQYEAGADASIADHEMELIQKKPYTHIDFDKIDHATEIVNSSEFKEREILEWEN